MHLLLLYVNYITLCSVVCFFCYEYLVCTVLWWIARKWHVIGKKSGKLHWEYRGRSQNDALYGWFQEDEVRDSFSVNCTYLLQLPSKIL